MAEEYSSDSNSESEYVVAVEEWGRQPLRRAGIQEPEIMEVRYIASDLVCGFKEEYREARF